MRKDTLPYQRVLGYQPHILAKLQGPENRLCDQAADSDPRVPLCEEEAACR